MRIVLILALLPYLIRAEEKPEAVTDADRVRILSAQVQAYRALANLQTAQKKKSEAEADELKHARELDKWNVFLDALEKELQATYRAAGYRLNDALEWVK